MFVWKWVPPIPMDYQLLSYCLHFRFQTKPTCAEIDFSISLQPNFKSHRLSLRKAGTRSLHAATPVLVQHAAGVGNQESFRSVRKCSWFDERPTAVRKRRFIRRTRKNLATVALNLDLWPPSMRGKTNPTSKESAAKIRLRGVELGVLMGIATVIASINWDITLDYITMVMQSICWA